MEPYSAPVASLRSDHDSEVEASELALEVQAVAVPVTAHMTADTPQIVSSPALRSWPESEQTGEPVAVRGPRPRAADTPPPCAAGPPPPRAADRPPPAANTPNIDRTPPPPRAADTPNVDRTPPPRVWIESEQHERPAPVVAAPRPVTALSSSDSLEEDTELDSVTGLVDVFVSQLGRNLSRPGVLADLLQEEIKTGLDNRGASAVRSAVTSLARKYAVQLANQFPDMLAKQLEAIPLEVSGRLLSLSTMLASLIEAAIRSSADLEGISQLP